MTGKSEQNFSFEIVSCLLAALFENGTVVGAKKYKLMAQIDRTKSASGYEHLFRSVKARAKEINDQIANGTIDVVAPGAKKTASKPTTPASGNKRGRKSKVEVEAEENEDEDDEETKSPSKKAKVVKEEKAEEDDDGLL